MTLGEPQVLTHSEQIRVRHIRQLNVNRLTNVSELLDMLIDPSWVVRRAVVESLALAGDAAVEALCGVLESKRDSEARIAATVDALVASTGGVDETLIAKLAGSADPAVLADVAQILGRRRSHSGVGTLVWLARHPDDNVAVISIEALGRIGGRTAVEALIEATRSGNFFRTFSAIDVLGRSEDPRAVEPLVKLLDNPSYTLEAIRALGRTGERRAAPSLLKLLLAPSDSVVRLAALSIWELRGRFAEKTGTGIEGFDEIIRTEVSGPLIRRLQRVFTGAPPAEAVAICKILGLARNSEASALLTEALQASGEIAQAAATALKSIGKEAELTLSVAIRDGDSQRRKILLPVVTRLTSVDDVTICLTDVDQEVRALACEALARIGNTTAVEQVFLLLDDKRPRVVHAATAAIQALGSRRARELAVKSADSENKNVRRAALRILGYFGDESALEPMLKGLSDFEPQVREAALQGLPYIEGPRALEALFGAAKSESERTRALAMRSLGQVPKLNEQGLANLLRGLGDSDSWVRYYAAQAIGKIGYAAAAPELAALLNDDAGQVRVAAVEALSRMNSGEAHKVIQTAAFSNEIEIRRAALLGLGIAHRPEDLSILIGAAGDQDASTRLMALSSLMSFASSAVVQTLSSAAHDSDEQVRSAALNFLAGRPELEATEALVSLLDQEKTRDKARNALLIPNGARVAGILIAFEEANDEMASLLVGILSRVDKSDTSAGLQAAMKLRNPAARKAAASGLAAREDVGVRGVLQEASEVDPDPEVRAICLLLLKG